MSKRDTLHSFQDLEASRFKKITEAPTSAAKTGHAPGKASKKKDPVPPDPADESALFLAAVSGTLDVSLKNAAPLEEPARKEAEPAGPAREPASSPVPEKTGHEELHLFARAMDGVAPIRAKGREITPPTKPVALPSEYSVAMDDIFSGKLEFSLEYTDEFIQGHVLGLDPVVLGKLRAGAYSPEGHIDLHGQNLEQAYAALAVFLKEAYHSGKRHLLVITGRGKNSPGGTPVLRERVQAWFTRDPFKRVVLAFCTAKNGDGGAGALYILLRKRKKNQGKIVWDRTPSEEELLL